MIRADQIPDEVVVALARALISPDGELQDALAAALAAWPFRQTERRNSINMLDGKPISYSTLMIPLPQEGRDV